MCSHMEAKYTWQYTDAMPVYQVLLANVYLIQSNVTAMQ